MPNWAGGVLTAKGRALQAKVEAGQTLELTKMKLGSGTPELEEIDNLTDLKQPQNIMGISSKIVENNICEVTSVILTSNINTPFYAREWGLFANDPDEGEILYMYTTDPNPDYIPNKNSALIISASYALNIAVLNVDNIIVNIDPAGLITTSILKKELKKYLPLSGGTLTGSLGVQDVLMVQKNGEDQPKLTIDDGRHRVDFIIDTNGEAKFLNESQEPVSLTVKDLHGTADKATADKNGREIDTGYLKTDGGTLTGSLGVQDVLMVQKNGEDQPKLTIDDGKHRVDFIIDTNGEARFLNESQEFVSLYAKDLHGTADKATADKNGREIDTGYLKTDGGTLTGSLGIQDVLMVQKQTAQPKINLTDGTHSLNIILDENGDVRFIDNSGKTLNIFVKQVIQG